jgi:hypothetical protein
MSKTSSELGGAFPFDFEPKKEPLPVNEELFCELPDGTLLCWEFGKRKSSIKNYTNNQDDNTLRGAINRAKKKLTTAVTEDQIKRAKVAFPRFFSMPENSEYKVIITEFDKLPRKIKSFAELYRKLRDCFPDEVIARSVSGKVKIFFLVRYYFSDLQSYEAPIFSDLQSDPLFGSTRFRISRPSHQPCYGPQPLPPIINHERALEMLSNLFYRHYYFLTQFTAESLIKAVDTQWAALRTSSISQSICNEIKNIKNARVHEMGVRYQQVQAKQSIADEKTPRKRLLRRFEGEIPKFLLPFQKKGKTRDSHDRFLRIILESKQLAYPEGFDMPLTKISKTCGKKPSQVAIWIRELEKAGLIKCIDEEYVIGEKAKTYVALGKLQDFLLELPGTNSFLVWPKTFQDNNWAKEGFKAICKLVSGLSHRPDGLIEEKLQAWIEGLEGLDSKFDRRPRLYSQLQTVLTGATYLEAWREEKRARRK